MRLHATEFNRFLLENINIKGLSACVFHLVCSFFNSCVNRFLTIVLGNVANRIIYTPLLMHVSPKVCSTTDKPINITVNSETLERYCELHKKFFKNLDHIGRGVTLELFESGLTFSLKFL